MSARSRLSGSRRESRPGGGEEGAEPAAGLLDDDALAGQLVDHGAQDRVVAAVGQAHPDPRGAQVGAEVAEGPRLVDLAEQQRRGDAGVPEGADELVDLAEAQAVVGVDLAGERGARLLVEADRDHPVAVARAACARRSRAARRGRRSGRRRAGRRLSGRVTGRRGRVSG